MKTPPNKRKRPSVAEDQAPDLSLAAPDQLVPYLKKFAETVTLKFSVNFLGEPENQLRAPFERFFEAYGKIIFRPLKIVGEAALAGSLGKPDFVVYLDNAIIGYVELKAPGKGANPEIYKAHDKEQWDRFRQVPNIIYTDGNEWGLYQNGELIGKRLRVHGDVCTDGQYGILDSDGRELFQIFAAFTSWTPLVPQKPKEIAEFLAPYCLLLRQDVEDALQNEQSPLHSLKNEIKKLLFPDATDRQFADAYAQTIIFALLLARMEKSGVLVLQDAFNTLDSNHLLLSRALQFLTDRLALKEIESSLSLAQRIIHEISSESLLAKDETEDPWLFFYEYFLSRYDPKLRKAWGVYYTPIEVVRCQVRLIDEILKNEFGKDMGFVEPGVITLDPGLGTGTYLLGIIEHALNRIDVEEGPGAVKGGARSLVHNLHGFEWMVGPYAVAQLRFSRALTSRGVTLPPTGIGIYLTNTLESPHVQPPVPPLFQKPIAQEHERALKIKDSEHVLVCLGNPPYGRHEAADEINHAVTGGWVRYGDGKDKGILKDFLEPARKAGFGIHLKNLYNQYVYFIRWAIWKVFEHKTAAGPGIVSFITASSYLEGDAFVGLREYMRRVCDRIDIIDLGGEGRGTRKDENVFAIQTPVAIFIAWRKARKSDDSPAIVRYTRIDGSREEKLASLNSIKYARNLKWQNVSNIWQVSFKPVKTTGYATWPLLSDIFPWQQSGSEIKRSWPIGPEPDVLYRRLKTLVDSPDKAVLFKESRDRNVRDSYSAFFKNNQKLHPIEAAKIDEFPKPVRYAFRSFDRQYLIPDNRVADYLRPSLWEIIGPKQLFFTSLFNHPLGDGPAITICSNIPDRHHFRGSFGGKDTLPLFRDRFEHVANILPGMIANLSQKYNFAITAEDIAGYAYAMLAHPEYTKRFKTELADRKVRVPLTKEGKSFRKAAEFGKALIWLHTYGERLMAKDRPKGKVPKGNAKCLHAVSENEESYPNEFHYDDDRRTLIVGDGRFGPVDPSVYEFEVSGLKVVKSWLGYRMRERSGKKSSPLDEIRPKSWTHEFTKELLELLWSLEKTVDGYPEQKRLLEDVLAGPLFKADELPPVPDSAREAPKPTRGDLEFPE